MWSLSAKHKRIGTVVSEIYGRYRHTERHPTSFMLGLTLLFVILEIKNRGEIMTWLSLL